MNAGDKRWFYNKLKNELLLVTVIRGPNFDNFCRCGHKGAPPDGWIIPFGSLFERKEDCLVHARVVLERAVKKWKTQYENHVRYLQEFIEKYGGDGA